MSLPVAVASGKGTEPSEHDAIVAVRPMPVAIGAGVLAALYLLAVFAVQAVPTRVIALFGGPETELQRVGGAQILYAPPPGVDVEAIARNSDGAMRAENGGLIVEVPNVKPEQLDEVVARFTGAQRLEFREVLEVREMPTLGPLLGLTMRSKVSDNVVDLDVDQWHPEDGGAAHTDFYLRGPTRESIEQVLAKAGASGWMLPEHAFIAFEHVESMTSEGQPIDYWRTYVVADKVELDGNDVADAMATYDPNTSRPIVLLDFTRAGGEKFADLTARIVGKKLATMLGGIVKSAPIINDPIRGGRASITMGGTDLRKQERERDELIATLKTRSLPPGGRVVAAEIVPPRDAAIVWVSRGAIAVGGGLLFALVVFGIVRATRPVRRRAAKRATGPVPMGRLLVTLSAPVVLWGAAQLRPLGLDTKALDDFMGNDTTGWINLASLGLTPVVTAFILAELIALVIPGLRWRRHAGPEARRSISNVVLMLGLALAVIQAWTIARYFERLPDVFVSSTSSRLLFVGSLVVATLVFVMIARLIREHGLGNGYGALVTAAIALVLGRVAWAGHYTGEHLLVLATIIAITVSVGVVLRWRVVGARETPLRVPLSGFVPTLELGGLVVFASLISVLGFEMAGGKLLERFVAWREHQSIAIAIVAVLTVICAWLFARPSVLEVIARRAGVAMASRDTWLRALGLSAAIVLLVAAIYELARRENPNLMSVMPVYLLAVATAYVLDAYDDWRARRVALDLVWTVQQPQHADLVEQSLAAAGIPCHLSSGNLRTVLAFFGPFVSIDVRVPTELVPEAKQRLAQLFEP